MPGPESLEEDLIAIKPRDYKCPCGKTYLSYAALFTHIKQKHDGKAPGSITKPPSQHEKRGRPPSRPRPKEPPSPTHQPVPGPPSHFPPETEQERQAREKAASENIRELVELLEGMPEEQLNKTHLNQIEAFSEMNVHMNTRNLPLTLAHGNLCIADGFVEFAQLVCREIRWRQFEPLYLLFMLLLQYIIDEENSKKVLVESNMDLFCEYINDFIEEHLHDMAEYYDFATHWIVRRENCVGVFFRFFGWCTHKRYITYRINLSAPN